MLRLPDREVTPPLPQRAQAHVDGDRAVTAFGALNPPSFVLLARPSGPPSIPTDMYDMYFYDSLSDAQSTLHCAHILNC